MLLSAVMCAKALRHRNVNIMPLIRPYSSQREIYDKNLKGNY
jgi:hypothetical protein